jgi:hypothetical protein
MWQRFWTIWQTTRKKRDTEVGRGGDSRVLGGKKVKSEEEREI